MIPSRPRLGTALRSRPPRGFGSPKAYGWSRRAVLGLFGGLLVGTWSAVRADAQMGVDPVDLWRLFRARKLARKLASRPVRLKDELRARTATMQLVRGGGPGTVLMIRLGSGPKFHTHTVSMAVTTGEGEQTFAVEPLPPSQTQTGEGEWVVAALEERHLDLICEAEAIATVIRGWDQELHTDLGPKDVGKLRDFCRDGRVAAAAGE